MVNLRQKFNALKHSLTNGIHHFRRLHAVLLNKAQARSGRISSTEWRSPLKQVNRSTNSCDLSRKLLRNNTTPSTIHDWKVSIRCKKSMSRWLLQGSSDWLSQVFTLFCLKSVETAIRQLKSLLGCVSSYSHRCCLSSSKLVL